jgi:hypothetical protein
MKDKYEDMRQEYIRAAILHRESSYNGDNKEANKQYKILKKIYEKIQMGIVTKDLLKDLLIHENVSVRSWAAAHMLGMEYEVSKAEQELKSIAISDIGMTGFSAEMTLKAWKQQGHLKF